jgi:hypothetical protein
VTARRQIAEGRRGQGRIAAGRRIVVRGPGTRIQPIMEGIVITAREIRQQLEAYVRRLRQAEVDLHLAGRGIRRRAEILIGAVVRPLDGLTTRSRGIAHHNEGRKQALAREAFQFDYQ